MHTAMWHTVYGAMIQLGILYGSAKIHNDKAEMRRLDRRIKRVKARWPHWDVC